MQTAGSGRFNHRQVAGRYRLARQPTASSAAARARIPRDLRFMVLIVELGRRGVVDPVC